MMNGPNVEWQHGKHYRNHEYRGNNSNEIGRTAMETFEAACVLCGETVVIKAHFSDLIVWKEGKLIQDALPYLAAEEREILISKTCGDCFRAFE